MNSAQFIYLSCKSGLEELTRVASTWKLLRKSFAYLMVGHFFSDALGWPQWIVRLSARRLRHLIREILVVSSPIRTVVRISEVMLALGSDL